MTRLGHLDGRAVIVVDSGIVDVATASAGQFSGEPQELYDRWDDFVAWASSADLTGQVTHVDDPAWLAPSPEPRQIIAIGINSRIKLEQFGLREPSDVGFISKLRAALAGPTDDVARTSDRVYAEAELALVVGRRAWQVSEAAALDHVAGVTVAGDLADADAYVTIDPREEGGPTPTYYNPAKSLPGFAPIGPHVVTLDEVGPLDDLRIQLRVDGRLVQDGTTADYVFSVPQVVSRLSQRVPLLPGDVILVGSPGQLEEAPLTPVETGSVLELAITSLGTHRHVVV